MRHIKYGSRVMEFHDGNDATLLCCPCIPTIAFYIHGGNLGYIQY